MGDWFPKSWRNKIRWILHLCFGTEESIYRTATDVPRKGRIQQKESTDSGDEPVLSMKPARNLLDPKWKEEPGKVRNKMEPAFECPNCKAIIEERYKNHITGFAFCSKCKKVYPYPVPTVTHTQLQEKPPRFVTVEKDFSGVTKITCRVLSFSVLLILVIFTALLTSFIALSIHAVFAKDVLSLHDSLCIIPFAAFDLLLVMGITFQLTGKWIIELRDGVGRVFVGTGNFGWNREFYYNSSSKITMLSDIDDFNKRSYQITKWIKISTNGSDFMFGSGMNNKAKHYISALLACVAKTL